MTLNKRVKLDGSKKDRIIRALEMAGWVTGRIVDIAHVEKYYESQNILLVEGAKAFFREFYGLAGNWYIKYECTPKAGPDFEFFLCPDGDWLSAKHFMIDNDECDFVKKATLEKFTYVGQIGYYYPARVWINQSGKIFATHEYDEDVHRFNSIIELIEWELKACDFDYVTITV